MYKLEYTRVAYKFSESGQTRTLGLILGYWLRIVGTWDRNLGGP